MITGKEGITAKIIKDSVNEAGVRLTTFELEYPRFILAEVNTHRMLSKNSASSRAIPFKKMMEKILTEPAMPVFWGANQPGMSASNELEGTKLEAAKASWAEAMKRAIEASIVLDQLGLHKQILNRIAEPWQRMKTVVTGTEWANLLWLRNHDAAQPEFHELGRVVQEAFNTSVPEILGPGEWHLPYVDHNDDFDYLDCNENVIDLMTAQKISSSCAAQVSYRKNDESLDKALDIYDKLVGADRMHGSPFEHLGTPMILRGEDTWLSTIPSRWEDGVTHMDRQGRLWSANFRGWVQYRKTIPGEAVW
jgi:thymidylate synthase ThyX